MDYINLINCAMTAKKMAYAPYSNFTVGAAVLTEDDKIYTGCNIENSSFGATNCAERTAIFKAVSEGHTKLKAIAIVGSLDEFTFPCGICRQVISEFSCKNLEIIIAKNEKEYIIKTIEELLPAAFSEKDLKNLK